MLDFVSFERLKTTVMKRRNSSVVWLLREGGGG